MSRSRPGWPTRTRRGCSAPSATGRGDGCRPPGGRPRRNGPAGSRRRGGAPLRLPRRGLDGRPGYRPEPHRRRPVRVDRAAREPARRVAGRVPGRAGRHSLDGRPPGTRQNVFVALRELLASAADGGGAVLLLDEPDLDDLATGLALEEAARLVPRHPLLVVTRGAPAGVPATAGDGDGDDDPAQAAERLIAAGRPEEAVATVLEASYAAMEAGDQEHVLRWTEAVRGQAEGPARAAVLALRADAFAATGDPSAVAVYRLAVAAAHPDRAPGLRARMARAALLTGDLALGRRGDGRGGGLRRPGRRGNPAGPRHAGLLLRRPGRRRGRSGGGPTDGAGARGTGPAPRRHHSAGHDRAQPGPVVRPPRTRAAAPRERTRASRPPVFDSHLCVAEYLLYGPTPYTEVVALAEQLRRAVRGAPAPGGEPPSRRP